jgi:hypothetical protein
MNRSEQATLEVLLNKLWDSRDGKPVKISGITVEKYGQLRPDQLELLAAAMRIVASTTNGPNIPPPPDLWTVDSGSRVAEAIRNTNPPTPAACTCHPAPHPHTAHPA